MNLISKAVVNLWSIYKPMNFRGRYLITYATRYTSYHISGFFIRHCREFTARILIPGELIL